MIQGVDQGEGGCAIEGSAVIEGSGDAYRCLVDIRDAEIDFSHVEVVPQYRGVEGGWALLECFRRLLAARDIIIWGGRKSGLLEGTWGARRVAAFEMQVDDDG